MAGRPHEQRKTVSGRLASPRGRRTSRQQIAERSTQIAQARRSGNRRDRIPPASARGPSCSTALAISRSLRPCVEEAIARIASQYSAAAPRDRPSTTVISSSRLAMTYQLFHNKCTAPNSTAALGY